jgi:hypothetical protein
VVAVVALVAVILSLWCCIIMACVVYVKMHMDAKNGQQGDDWRRPQAKQWRGGAVAPQWAPRRGARQAHAADELDPEAGQYSDDFNGARQRTRSAVAPARRAGVRLTLGSTRAPIIGSARPTWASAPRARPHAPSFGGNDSEDG